MIEVDYNEYKETIASNMELIQENHKLKEKIKEQEKKYEKLEEHCYYVERTNKQLNEMKDKAIENINKYERIHGINYTFENEDFKEELLNILKGE